MSQDTTVLRTFEEETFNAELADKAQAIAERLGHSFEHQAAEEAAIISGSAASIACFDAVYVELISAADWCLSAAA